ncbi:DUF2071 domain-containing protein [Spirosoma agri]
MIFANYTLNRQLLEPLVPYGTELDEFEGICYGSLVGFYFQRVKLLGQLAIPFHTEFEEFNLRFYVRRKTPTGWRRGVVFVKEVVPKPAITLVARALYGEPYQTHSMRHTWQLDSQAQHIAYEWKVGTRWNHIRVQADRHGHGLVAQSEEAFITEHYWGYTRRGDGRTSEYEVVHPAWDIYQVHSYEVDCDALSLYGPGFAPFLGEPPVSVFLAEGSSVAIKSGASIG